MTRTERNTYPDALKKDRSLSKSGYDKSMNKHGSGAHNWGSIQDETKHYLHTLGGGEGVIDPYAVENDADEDDQDDGDLGNDDGGVDAGDEQSEDVVGDLKSMDSSSSSSEINVNRNVKKPILNENRHHHDVTSNGTAGNANGIVNGSGGNGANGGNEMIIGPGGKPRRMSSMSDEEKAEARIWRNGAMTREVDLTTIARTSGAFSQSPPNSSLLSTSPVRNMNSLANRLNKY